MKFRSGIILALGMSLSLVACQKGNNGSSMASNGVKPDTTKMRDRVSYSIGYSMGKNFKENDATEDINPAVVEKGMSDAMTGDDSLMTQDQMRKAISDFRTDMMQKQQKKQQALAQKGTQESKKFLAENKTKKGVITTKSGLEYKILKKGTGPTPKASDTVVVDYSGKLVNGKVFDSSYKRGKPATFPVDHVIPGWTEALEMMHVGAKWRLFIPPNLAYGSRGAGNVIPPNSVLIFDVELHSIKKGK